jgi:D-alanyl-D-alanine carboxypeptidase
MLTHTSGIMDTFNTQSFKDYAADVVAGGEARTFTLEDQVLAAVKGGDPTGAPGERQQYTDTGYILLGAILEELTVKDMAAATRSLSGYGELDLENTWWEIFEPPPPQALPRARQYLGEFPGDGFGAEPFDLYGGGGMISSADDLARYFWALFHGDVFESPATLDLMKSKFQPEIVEGNSDLLVRHGLQAFDIDGHILYGHHGWWGVSVYYSPEADVLIAANWLQQLSGDRVGAQIRGIVADVLRLTDFRQRIPLE